MWVLARCHDRLKGGSTYPACLQLGCSAAGCVDAACWSWLAWPINDAQPPRPPAADGYDVDYLRVPVTDEKAPKPSDFQLLIEVRLCAAVSHAGCVPS